ncbi:MAG: PIN domain nuclease, partial [Candidatus Aminicenantes bacterium]|nr:PIN domain nuclease [Candidatus Aminicenantes bacterium]
MGIWIFRAFVLSLITIGGYFYPPFRLDATTGAGAAFLAGALMMFLETRIRRVSFRVLWSAGWGLLAGLLLGWFFGAVYRSVVRTPEMDSFIRIFFLVIMPYIGLLIGTKKPEWLEPANIAGLFKEKRPGRSHKILDTSVIIDGRIADLCDTGF